MLLMVMPSHLAGGYQPLADSVKGMILPSGGGSSDASSNSQSCAGSTRTLSKAKTRRRDSGNPGSLFRSHFSSCGNSFTSASTTITRRTGRTSFFLAGTSWNGTSCRSSMLSPARCFDEALDVIKQALLTFLHRQVFPATGEYSPYREVARRPPPHATARQPARPVKQWHRCRQVLDLVPGDLRLEIDARGARV